METLLAENGCWVPYSVILQTNCPVKENQKRRQECKWYEDALTGIGKFIHKMMLALSPASINLRADFCANLLIGLRRELKSPI